MADAYEQRARQLLKQRLGRPVGHLQALERLDPATRGALDAAIGAAIERRRRQLDGALARVLPRPLRALLLRGLAR